MNSKKRMGLCLATTAALALTACASGQTPAASTTSEVTIGVIEMLTGDSAFYGNAVLEGIEVAKDEINAAGGILGKQISLKVEDNASDNAQSTTLARTFASDSTIGAAIPPTYQPNFNAACAAANAGGLPLVSAQSGAPDAAGNTKGMCYTMTTDPVAQVSATLDFLSEKEGMKKFVMVYDQDNGYVDFQRPNIAKAAADGGYELVEIGVAAGTSDYSPQITKVLGENADAVFPFFTIEDAARFMSQSRAKGMDKPFFDPVSQLTSRRLIELSGGAAEGLLASTPQSAGDVESFEKFLELYKTKHGEELDDPTYTGFGYDALHLIAKAMTEAESTTDRKKIQEAIDSLSEPCLSICFTKNDDGAFLANNFFLVTLTADGFKPVES